jgi:Zn-finger nucleic acid-binding protein
VLGPVHVEYCDRCHGIFLDKGELDQAVQAVAGTTVRQVITLAGSVAR